MAPDSHVPPPRLSEVVREAAGIVDPEDESALVGDLERWFEDDDEPVTTLPSLERRLAGRGRSDRPGRLGAGADGRGGGGLVPGDAAAARTA